MSLPDVIICALAAWRLAYLLTSERGVFGIGAGIRRLVGVRSVDVEKTTSTVKYTVQECQGNNELAKMLCCIYCTSVWTAGLMLLLWLTGWQPVVYLLAIAALAVLIEKANRYV